MGKYIAITRDRRLYCVVVETVNRHCSITGEPVLIRTKNND